MRMDFPLTPYQARVLFHVERLLRSTGAGRRNSAATTYSVHAELLDHMHVTTGSLLAKDWNLEQCKDALRKLEELMRKYDLHHFRDIDTGWEQLK